MQSHTSNSKHECDITQEAVTTELAKGALALCRQGQSAIGKYRFLLKMNSSGLCKLIAQDRTCNPKKVITTLKVDRKAGALIDTTDSEARVLILNVAQQNIISKAVCSILKARNTQSAIFFSSTVAALSDKCTLHQNFLSEVPFEFAES